jgi:hypothetical protein
MASELCEGGEYNLQRISQNHPGFAFSVLISATGSHRTTGYRTFWTRVDVSGDMPTFAFHHERTERPDLEMMTAFEVTFEFESSTDVTRAKILDSNGEHVIKVQNIPTLKATCPA